MKRALPLLLLWATVILLAQTTVNVTASGQVNGQTVTASVLVGPKVPKITGTFSCPANTIWVAGTTINCTYAVSVAPTVSATVNLTSADTTQFTVPATVTIPAGATSVIVPVTVTP